VNLFFDLDASAGSIVERAEKVAADVLARESKSVDREGRFPRVSIDALAEAGLLGLTVPTRLGGLGAGPTTFAVVAETIARSCASTGMVWVMHVCATNVIAAHPPRDEGEKLLRSIAAGRHVSTLAFSEKGSRSHFWAPVSREVARDGKTLISADKSFVTSAGDADSYVVSTLAHDSKTPTESSLWLVRKGAKGLSALGAWDGLGMRGNGSAPMKLEQVEVREDDRVSEPGKGFDAMLGIVLPWFQVGTAAISVGIAESAFAATAAHVSKTRLEHLNETLASIPGLRANVAHMRIEIDRARAQLATTTRAMERPGADPMGLVLESKAQAAEMAIEVTDLAMRSCGGAAFSKMLPIERHFRDARAAAVMAPTSEVLLDFIGKASLGLPLF
jgi:alkylation response protein AidB-like acyl-CoA dehydrogenase